MNSQTENCRRFSSTSHALRNSAISLALLVALSGCSRGGPKRLIPPRINAGNAAEQAMEMYDQDGDGFIAGEELEAAPALNAAMSTLDTDNDGEVSESEIIERIRVWQGTAAALAGITCVVTMDGRPLEAANVTFEPEAFLGDELRTAIAYTDAFGEFSPSVPKKDRLSPDMPYGLSLGFYKVRFSKEVNGKETIPAIYNTETILGQQVSPDDPVIVSPKKVFRLKSR